MNKQEYIAKLERENGYCSCPEIADLLSLRRTMRGLAERCESLHQSIDANQENDEFSRDYQDVSGRLRLISDSYYFQLAEEAGRKRVKFMLHDSNRGKPLAEIPLEQVKSMMLAKSGKSGPIVTAHCSRCSQQIDVLGYVPHKEK